jgi:hypothetical protein
MTLIFFFGPQQRQPMWPSVMKRLLIPALAGDIEDITNFCELNIKKKILR